MNAYGPLAGVYDELTRDVAYESYARYYEDIFVKDGGEFRLLLDLCCGTGSLSCLMAERGYEIIGADASADMLMVAMRKSAGVNCAVKPLFINQAAEELDLYGTVDAAFSSLDSLNYVAPAALREALRRLRLFIRPGGLLLFDIRTPEFLRGMDGSVSIDETDDVFCVWRGRFDPALAALRYGMDIFTLEDDGSYSRSTEEHIEYAHSVETIEQTLKEFGFADIAVDCHGALHDSGRLYFIARRGEN